jgi:hypothetical protein
MDIQLPDVSGLQVAQGGEHLRHIPVIAKKIRQGGCDPILRNHFPSRRPRNCAQLSPRAMPRKLIFERSDSLSKEVAKFIVGQTCIATNQGFGIVQGRAGSYGCLSGG